MSRVFGLVSLTLSVKLNTAGPRGCPVLYLAGCLLTVSAVSPYTDEWEVSRPFPKAFIPLFQLLSRGMTKETGAPPPGYQPPSREVPTWRRAWKEKSAVNSGSFQTHFLHTFCIEDYILNMQN